MLNTTPFVPACGAIRVSLGGLRELIEVFGGGLARDFDPLKSPYPLPPSPITNHLQSIPTMSQQDLSNLSPEQAQQVMQQVRQQGAMQAQQEILVSSSKKCFEKCVTRPGATLSNKEQTCLAMCFDRYLETMQVVSQSMSDRSNQ